MARFAHVACLALAVCLTHDCLAAAKTAKKPASKEQPASVADALPASAPAVSASPQNPSTTTDPYAASTRQLSHQAIKQAIKDTLAENREPPSLANQITLSANNDPYAQFAAAMTEAKVPDCLHSEGLKRQPTGIGPFRLTGFFALPMIAVAKIRGKCI
jgi:hypothetical protein